MYLFVLFAAGICLGIAYVISKRLALEKYHPATYTALISFISAILAIPLLFYQFKVPFQINFWLLAVISMFAFGLGYTFSFRAYKSIDVSAVTLIGRLNIVVAAVLGIIFLSERYTAGSYLGFLLILLGSCLIIYEKGKLKLNIGVFYAFFMAIGIGLAAVFDKILLRQFSPFTYVFINNFFIGLVFMIIFRVFKEAVDLFTRNTKLVILTAFLSVTAWAAFLFVLKSGAVSKIFPIYESTSLISTVLLGILLLGEKEKLTQKTLGTIIVVSGIFLLG